MTSSNVVEVMGISNFLNQILKEKQRQKVSFLDKKHYKLFEAYIIVTFSVEKTSILRDKREILTLVDEGLQDILMEQRKANSKQPISKTTQEYAKNALRVCNTYKEKTDSDCKGLQYYNLRRNCSRRKAALNDPAFARFNAVIKDIAFSENPVGSEISAAGDIGQFVSMCRSVSCSAYSKAPESGLCSHQGYRHALQELN